MTPVRTLAPLLFALLFNGCAYHLAATGGYVASPSGFTGYDGIQLDGHLGMGLGGGGGSGSFSSQYEGGRQQARTVAFGAAFRLRSARSLTQVGVGPEITVRLPTTVSPYARAGVDLLQFESHQGSFGFGMLSPHLELGVGFCSGASGTSASNLCFTVSGLAGFDLRLTSQPSAAYLGGLAGLTFVFGT